MGLASVTVTAFSKYVKTCGEEETKQISQSEVQFLVVIKASFCAKFILKQMASSPAEWSMIWTPHFI